MTVIRPNSISGVSSITGQGGDISIFRADGTAGDLVVNNVTTGIVTATTFVGNVTGAVTGSGANLTNLPAGNLTGTVADARLTTVSSSKLSGALPALDGSALTGVGASFGNSSVNTSGIITATAFVPSSGQLSHRNIISNGACMVAQRGTSSGSTGYQTVDRFKLGTGGADEALQQYQGTIASHESPYNEGHRYSYYIMNGNQTGGAGSGDYAEIQYKVEAQDMATCGWNYTSSSSFITLSFWLKSNVGQNFYGFVYSADGTAQRYIFQTGTITANSWNKIVVTIPGGTNVQFDSDVNEGFIIKWIPFYGTDKTNNSATVGSWANYNGAARCPDNTSTWWTTDNSTFYLTGVQLEVGPVATPFEHRNYQEELLRCQRYFYAHKGPLWGETSAGDHLDIGLYFPVPMRASPSFTQVDTSLAYKNRLNQGNNTSGNTYSVSGGTNEYGAMWIARPASGSWDTQDGRHHYWHPPTGNTSYSWSAEL